VSDMYRVRRKQIGKILTSTLWLIADEWFWDNSEERRIIELKQFK